MYAEAKEALKLRPKVLKAPEFRSRDNHYVDYVNEVLFLLSNLFFNFSLIFSVRKKKSFSKKSLQNLRVPKLTVVDYLLLFVCFWFQ